MASKKRKKKKSPSNPKKKYHKAYHREKEPVYSWGGPITVTKADGTQEVIPGYGPKRPKPTAKVPIRRGWTIR